MSENRVSMIHRMREDGGEGGGEGGGDRGENVHS